MTTQLAEPSRQDDDLSQDESAGPDQPEDAGRQHGSLLRLWQRMRIPLALIALVAVGGVVIALLAPRPRSNTYLDPASSDPSGTKALADILKDRGFNVVAAYSPQSALSDLGASSGTLVITSPGLLTSAQRAQLARAGSDIMLVEPGTAALAAFAPGVRVAHEDGPFANPVDPACGLAGAELAGSADLGGMSYDIPSDATGCYIVDGFPALVRFARDGRTITILGSGQALSNGLLGIEGNAALALNLLSGQRTIVWLTPEPTIAHQSPQAGGQSRPALIPQAAWLVVLQLVVALVLAALWRMRRFGPLIAERLPVVVRASETVEGHARLYQSRRARGRAASVLRAAMIARTKPALGLAADAPLEAVAAALASQSRLSAAEITAILDGPPPAADADLVKLADELDKLEREVRAQ